MQDDSVVNFVTSLLVDSERTSAGMLAEEANSGSSPDFDQLLTFSSPDSSEERSGPRSSWPTTAASQPLGLEEGSSAGDYSSETDSTAMGQLFPETEWSRSPFSSVLGGTAPPLQAAGAFCAPSALPSHPPTHAEGPPPSKKRRREESSASLAFYPKSTPEWQLVVPGPRPQRATMHFLAEFVGRTASPDDVEPGALVHFRRNMFQMLYSLSLKGADGQPLGASDVCAQLGGPGGEMVGVTHFSALVTCLCITSQDWSTAREVVLHMRPKGTRKATEDLRPVTVVPNSEPVRNVHDRVLFGESTSRRHGLANEFFHLQVTLVAHTQSGTTAVISTLLSTPIAVLCGNPASYKKGKERRSVSPPQKEAQAGWEVTREGELHTDSRVRLGTEVTGAQLSVAGDIAVTGTMYRPSDRRIKSHITPVEAEDQLENLRNIKVYDYVKKDPGTGRLVSERGVIAQELREVMPGAVHEVALEMSEGEVIPDFNVVEERVLLFETIGATQALDGNMRHLEGRVSTIEEEEGKERAGGAQASLLPWFMLLTCLIALLVVVVLAGVVVLVVTRVNHGHHNSEKCQPGMFMEGNRCVPCNDDNPCRDCPCGWSGMASKDSCHACGEGFWSPEGTHPCGPCPTPSDPCACPDFPTPSVA